MGLVRGLPAAGKFPAMIDGCSRLVPLAPVLELPIRHSASKWPDARRVAVTYFNCVDVVALPDSFPDKPVLAPDDDHIEPALAAPSCSDPTPSEPERNAAGGWGESFSMAPLFFLPIRLSSLL